jgi:hypothetical protein
LLYVLIAVALGCSGNNDQKEEKAREGVFAPQLKAIGKAKEVDQQIEDSAAKQRQAIDEQGG